MGFTGTAQTGKFILQEKLMEVMNDGMRVQHRCVLPQAKHSTYIFNVLTMFQRPFDGERPEESLPHRAKAALPLLTRRLRRSSCRAFHCNESRLHKRVHSLPCHRHHLPYLLEKRIVSAFCYPSSLLESRDKLWGTSSSYQMLPLLHVNPETKKAVLVLASSFKKIHDPNL